MKGLRLLSVALLYLAVIIASKFHPAARFLYYILTAFLALIFGTGLIVYLRYYLNMPMSSDKYDEVLALRFGIWGLVVLNVIASSLPATIIFVFMGIVFEYLKAQEKG